MSVIQQAMGIVKQFSIGRMWKKIKKIDKHLMIVRKYVDESIAAEIRGVTICGRVTG